MEHFIEPLASYLQEVGICSVIELYIYIAYESPMASFGEIIFYPILARPEATCSFEGMVGCLYALGLCWASEFLDAFFTLSLDLEHDFQMLSLFYGIVSADIYDEGFGDWWDLIFPYVIAIHYLHAVALCWFITLCIHCGLTIQYRLPAWEVSCCSILRSAREYSAHVRGLLGKGIGVGQSVLLRFLDWFLPEHPASLIIASTGLIIVDILLAIWTTKAIIPIYFQIQIMMSAILSGIDDNNNNTGFEWALGDDMDDKDWKSRAIEWLYAAVQFYLVGFEEWYDSRYEDDGLRHFPFLTLPITVLLVSYACKLLWEDKPRQLVEHELIIEETLLKDAVVQDFESHLRIAMNKMGEYTQVLGANSWLLVDAIAEKKKLLNEYKSLSNKMDNMRTGAINLNQRFQMFVAENMALHQENDELQKEVSELRPLNDVKVHRENIQALNDQLAASKDENISLHQQKTELERQLKSIRDAKSAVDTRATTAKEAEKQATIEGSNLRQDMDKLRQDRDELRQENSNLQQTNQQLVSENQTLLQAKSDAEATARNHEVVIDSLNKSSQAAEQMYQQLQTKLVEAGSQSIATRQVAEEAFRSLQTELDNLKVQHRSKVKELDAMKAHEDHTKKENKKRVVQLRKVHRLRQKKLVIMKRTFMTHQQRLNMDIDGLRKHNQRLEHRLVQLNPALRGHTQVIHDQRKDNETGQLKQQLQQHRSRNIILDGEVQRLTAENMQLRAQATAIGPGAVGPQSESDQLVTLRTELKNKEEELQRLRIQVSNANLSRSSPFMRRR